MISSKSELELFLESDRKALGIKKGGIVQSFIEVFFPDEIWKFEKILRYTEYYHNVKSVQKWWYQLPYYIYRIKLRRQSIKLGFSIPINVCGKGLSIAHYGSIVISANAHIGDFCRIHTNVNIGASAGKLMAPSIGNNVYIGPWAILFGEITITDNVTIGANATVNTSCIEQHSVLAGTPAKIVKMNYPNWLEFNNVNI